jgi:lipopolysaccharide transport system permease protein
MTGNRGSVRMIARRVARIALSPFSALTTHFGLTRELTRRDVLGRYRGANFGLLWTVLGPLMMLVIYAVAFGEILGGRWQRTGQASEVPFGLVLFLGITVHGLVAECLVRSPRLMIENANYVKRVVFPLHVLPWTVVLSTAFHFMMQLAVFVVLAAVVAGRLSAWLPMVVVVLVPLLLLTLAASLVLSSIGAYLRDLGMVIPVVVTALLFLSSAIIPVETLQPKYQIIFALNPLTFFIDQVRDVALWGNPPDWVGLAVRTIGGVVLVWLAHAWFKLTSRGFADVI